MNDHIKKHVDEIYATGKTTFRDADGEYEDFVVELKNLVGNWTLNNNSLIVEGIVQELELRPYFDAYLHKEIKQLCIDYYEDD